MAQAQRRNNRIEAVLDEAAACFAQNGYGETTMREIATRANMLPGSLYYHFPSKERLLLAVYKTCVARLCESIDAIARTKDSDPWQQLEAVVAVHIRAINDPGDYARVMLRIEPQQLPGIRKELLAERAKYERRFETLVDALPLQTGIDRKLLRLFLLGAANWTRVWFRAGPESPDSLARELVRYLRDPTASAEIPTTT